MATSRISVHTRKRLLLRSGGVCAFPSCDTSLLEATPDGQEDTIIGQECHIVPRRDDRRVARAPSSLSDEERSQYAELINDRDCFANLVMMCSVHSTVIDDPAQNCSVAKVVEMKRQHEADVDRRRSPEDRLTDRDLLTYATIVDEWERRFGIDEWGTRMNPLVGDGHPRMNQEYYDALEGGRAWLFGRIWPEAIPELNAAFENFRWVCSELQPVLSQHPHDHLAKQGVVAIARFYNDYRYYGPAGEETDFQRLDAMYEFYSRLVEDLAFELTRAANLICDTVREKLDASYRISEGVITLTSGPYSDFTVVTHRPHYARESGSRPYPGLREFLTARADRDEARGEGGPPEGVRLPGETRWD